LCGAGHWRIVIVALAITFAVLMAGGPIERRVHRAIGGKENPAEKPAASVSPTDTPRT
jgi:putative Mg2+ transporter-C (MgtC) family protein